MYKNEREQTETEKIEANENFTVLAKRKKKTHL